MTIPLSTLKTGLFLGCISGAVIFINGFIVMVVVPLMKVIAHDVVSLFGS